MRVVVAALVCFVFVDSSIAFLAEVAVEGFAGFTSGFRLYLVVCQCGSALIIFRLLLCTVLYYANEMIGNPVCGRPVRYGNGHEMVDAIMEEQSNGDCLWKATCQAK